MKWYFIILTLVLSQLPFELFILYKTKYCKKDCSNLKKCFYWNCKNYHCRLGNNL